MKEFTGFLHGVNLGGWLSQCDHTKETYDTFITEKDIENISKWGLDHIRVPIDYDLVETETGEYIESVFDYIQRAIDWCGKFGLNMILDLHKTFGFSFDSGEIHAIDYEDTDSYKITEMFINSREQILKRLLR